jgi:hypothetical protein
MPPARQIEIYFPGTCRPTAQTLPLNWRDYGTVENFVEHALLRCPRCQQCRDEGL